MPADGLWEGVNGLLERLTPELASEHGLGPLEARRLRLAGDEVPGDLFREERASRAAALVAPSLLKRARDAYDGPLLLVKGPELVARYPDAARRFGDLDLVAGDAEEAQAALLAAGFRLQERDWPPEGYDDVRRPHYHLHPLEWPGLGLRIEIHKHVKWPEHLRPPANEELFEAAVPSIVGVEGLLAPSPDHHAIVLVSHAWGEIPMRRLRQLVDVLAFVDDRDRPDLRRLAGRWGIERGWSSTLAVADWLLRGDQEPRLVGVWARYLRELREPNVLEMHVQEWLSPFWLTTPSPAARKSFAAVVRDLKPRPNQTWGGKVRQTARALTHPRRTRTEHYVRSGYRRTATGQWRRNP
jgi:putative nucleotidyltransferase-like protein